MIGITLLEDIVLLSHDDEGVNHADPTALGCAVAGAALTELMLAGRLTVVDGRTTVADPTPTGEPLLDRALTKIAAEQPYPAKDWVGSLGDDLWDRALDRLVERGVLERRTEKVLLVFPRTRYASATGGEPAPETATRRAAATVLDGAGPADARTSAILSLVAAAGLVGTAFPDRDADEATRRIAEHTAQAWPDEAVRHVVREVAAAIDAVLLFTTTHQTLFTDNS